MSDEITQAFAHPEERAKAMGGPNPPDRLSLRDYVVSADIGAFQVERGQEQRLRFNVVVELAPQGEAGDDVDLILSYDRLTEAIDAELAAERLNLLETLSENIAARILAEPQAERVFLRIEKLDRGPYALGVEIVRSRADIAGPAVAAETPMPVVHVSGQGGWQIGRALGPAVVVPPLPEKRPVAATGVAQLRIDLLSMEQAAWGMAADDTALTVVATRTELDWALKQGQVVVWAPSKLVLDTPGAPQGADAGVLACWLAEDLGATKVIAHGDVAIPAGCRVPVERV
ncbi:dihydroneopterin aldolase [Defluviimonas aestuarii]|uniref:dihydroneopterin aldolase n=1 Tax=Albidovulum aestuarii TaxID=1130726 RepID=UPI00249C77C2|nr:dihydroneopterin aldolase [Defluviimonas aestuarii]MDI3335221.1 dihydroneopterin aldolase [Defluviimonas aestuarii]